MTDDSPLLDLDAGLWLSIAEIARTKGKSRQAIAKRVAGLVDAGKLETRPGEGGTKLVNLAQFDRAVGEIGDASKEAAAETAGGDDDADNASPTYRDHQAREKQYAADLKFLELEERLGNLVPIGDLTDAANKCAEACVRSIDRLTGYSESMAAAVGKDGAAGARSKFKEVARDLRKAIAEAFGELAGSNEPLRIATEENESDA
jgi:biotin operon repressor